MDIAPVDLTGAHQAAPDSGWLGRLELGYAPRGGRTILARRRHQGPLLVQRSFHPEGPVCHSYVIHPPGGVAGGDRLQMEVTLAPDSQALLTTPAAAKFYRTRQASARQEQGFTVGPGASLEFLPMETILHGQSRVRLHNRFHLARSARLCTWDVLCLGRPGHGDHYAGGACLQDLWIERDGAPLLHDRLNLEHGDPLLTRPWGLDGHPVLGNLVATPAPDGIEQALRDHLGTLESLRVGVSRIGDVLVLRCLGPGAEAIRMLLQRAWRFLREPVIGRAPCDPRIWTT
ncbi:urease accessory protein UreD [Thioalkalivibrio sp. ALE31]|uniref:urease accessory protein UreD n=1 Tax=Thioalkalivibrio sp. ALE31 TaxID=1158182 RepID=UPI00037D2D66|nr:urease accessory protein UreD [Thioalkalivibrio sp. ALE31]